MEKEKGTVDYRSLKARCEEFLRDYRAVAPGDAPNSLPKFKYQDTLQSILDRKHLTLPIEVDDVIAWGAFESGVGEGVDLAKEILGNTPRYIELFSQAADELLATMEPSTNTMPRDTIDLLNEQRMERERLNRLAEDQQNGLVGGLDENPNHAAGGGIDPQNSIPPVLTRRYELRIIPPSTEKAVNLRSIKSAHIGRLVKVSGVVTRVSEVKPRAAVVCYHCGNCNNEVYQPVSGRQFMPLQGCPDVSHTDDQSTGRLTMEVRHSKFIKHQEVKLQEPADQVPVGHIPRTMTVHVSGELTRQCTAGDTVTISGVFLPVPLYGLNAMKSGLLSETFVEATSIDQMKRSYESFVVTSEMEENLAEIARGEDVYTHLARSIAPEIFGHEDVKKALLLLLVGAPVRKLKDGMRLRGDIHVCLMGDPGVAKSQLLKYITKVAPRGVYTTGKGSSGVGLTAAVMRDQTTGEMTLEGGALILADHGIACIDEFDKMNDSDRTAIHEVMEQQTVSIAKAGITTTLNARASVLAAANPAYGRYRKDRSPAENINLPAALLSRFDLLFLMLDRADADSDLALARHVTHVHRTGEHPPLGFSPIEPKLIRAYIAEARRGGDPLIAPDGALAEYIVNSYVTMRADEAASGSNAAGYTTARSLLSVLRLSQAMARLRFSEEVSNADVDEAMRLIVSSKASLDEEDEDAERQAAEKDPITALYKIIRQYNSSQASQGDVLTFAEIEPVVLNRGFSREQLMDCLDEYDSLGVWKVDLAHQNVHMVM